MLALLEKVLNCKSYAFLYFFHFFKLYLFFHYFFYFFHKPSVIVIIKFHYWLSVSNLFCMIIGLFLNLFNKAKAKIFFFCLVVICFESILNLLLIFNCFKLVSFCDHFKGMAKFILMCLNFSKFLLCLVLGLNFFLEVFLF